MDLIIAIAMLCQTGTGSLDRHATDNDQLDCQQYYVDCVDNKATANASRDKFITSLKKCIKERKVIK